MTARRFGTSWLWSTAIAMIAATTVALFAHSGAVSIDGTFHVPWWALVMLFGLAETYVFHVQLHRETQTFSLNEIPLVLGLFFSTPSELVIGQALGVGLALALYRRQPPLKLVYNVGQFTLSTLAAIFVFRAVQTSGALLAPAELLAAFLATTAAVMVGTAAVIVAISLSEGKPTARQVARNLGFGFAGTWANTGLALLGVLLLRVSPASAWLLALPAGLLFAAYRGYTVYRLQNERLSLLAEATRQVERSVSFEPALNSVLDGARELVKGEVAILRFLGETPDEPVLEVRLDLGAEAQLSYVQLNWREGVWGRVATEGRAILLAKPISDLKERDHCDGLGLRDAVIVPVWGREGVAATLLVGNRRGDVETFTGESLALLETYANQVGTALENVRLLSKLQQVVDELTEAGRRKDETLANVAHDMRNPLTSLMAFIHLLEDDQSITSAERHRFLQMMTAQGSQLRVLIDDLMTRAKEETRAPLRDVSRIEVAGLLREVVTATAASRDGHFLEVVRDPACEFVVSASNVVVRILGNLVTNAFKYSPSGSTVILSARADGNRGVTFSVRDEGVGVPADVRERVFDRYFKVSADSLGAGLGLSISKALATELGGRIWLESSVEGRGSEFCLWIPSSGASTDSIDVTDGASKNAS